MTPEGLREWATGLKSYKWHMVGSVGDHPPVQCTACDAYRAASMVLGVMEIHKAIAPKADEGAGFCAGCEWSWPCPTVTALVQEMEGSR